MHEDQLVHRGDISMYLLIRINDDEDNLMRLIIKGD